MLVSENEHHTEPRSQLLETLETIFTKSLCTEKETEAQENTDLSKITRETFVGPPLSDSAVPSTIQGFSAALWFYHPSPFISLGTLGE